MVSVGRPGRPGLAGVIGEKHMLQRLRTTCLLRPQDVPASQDDMQVIGVFNPGVTEFNDQVLLLIRIAESPRQQREGMVGLPRWVTTTPGSGGEGGRIITDWLAADKVDYLDPRVVRLRDTGELRLTFTSHLLLARSRNGDRIDELTRTRFTPGSPYETFGVEDPRITRIGDVYYFTYVAVSPHGAATALGSTTDFVHFRRHGIIFCPDNKDVVLFPRKIAGTYAALHRPNPRTQFSTPQMWLARSGDLLRWGQHEFFYGGQSGESEGEAGSQAGWESGRVGAGAPPVLTDRGYVEIYHANHKPAGGGDVGTYCAAAMLLDAENPRRILKRTPGPILLPTEPFEREGFIPNVVFPTGLIDRGDSLLVYYGAADTCTAVVQWRWDELLRALR
jgi:beta-1,2-mannobiose phosphorylase / 1,2-beta-oligomannan phosphorylase